MKIAQLFMELVVDTDKAKKEGKAATEGLAKELGNGFARIFGAAALGEGIRRSIDAASDLNETVSKTQVVFGASGDSVVKWAKTTDKSMGLSQKAALDAASTFAVFGKGAGLATDQLGPFSQNLVKLAADFASFYNTSPEQAIYAIGAALRGESEPIRQYGVLLDDATLKQRAMTMGLYEGKGVLDQHARVLAAQAEILAQSTVAQGDFARTADGLANSQRIATAEAQNSAASLGQNFLPVYKVIVQTVGELTSIFGNLPGAIQIAMVAFAGLAVFGQPIKRVVGIIQDLAKFAGTAATAIGGLSTATQALIGVVGLAAAAFALYMYAQNNAEKQAARVAKVTDETAQALKNEVDAVVKLRQETDDHVTTIESAEDAQKAFNKALLEGGANGAKLQEAVGALGLGADDLSTILKSTKGNIQSFISAQLQSRGVAKSVADETARVIDKYDDWNNTIDRLKDKDMGGEISKIAKSMNISEDAATQLVHQLANFDDVVDETDLNGIAKGFLNTAAGADASAEAMVKQAEAIAGTSRNGDEAYKVYAAYVGLLEQQVAPAVNTVTKSQKELEAGLAPLIGRMKDENDTLNKNVDIHYNAEDAAKALQDQVKKEADQFGRATDLANDFATALDILFGSNRDVEKATRDHEAAIDDITASYKENGKTLDISTDKGRANREMIDKNIDSIFALAEANISNGTSTKDATTQVQLYIEQLKQQLTAAGYSKEAIDQYIASLNLTPENISTTIDLVGDQEAKKSIDTLLTKLGDTKDPATGQKGLSSEWNAKIQTLIDQGSYQYAAALLKALEVGRTVPLFVDPHISGPSNFKVVATAEGAFIKGGANQLRSFGEIPGSRGDEVVLPLGNQARMRQLLSDRRVSGRVASALEGSSSGGSSPNYGSGGGITIVNPPRQTIVVPVSIGGSDLRTIVVELDQTSAGDR